MSNLPPLPNLSGDLLLDVFTHRTLLADDTPKCNDNERLAELGEKVLSLMTTTVLFHQDPILTTDDIAKIRDEHFSDTKVNEWVESYGLRSKLRIAPEKRETINSSEETRLLFNSYFGAVYCQSGIPPIHDWISRIIDPSGETTRSPQSDPSTLRLSTTPPPPSTAPPPLPAAPHQFLPLINQTAAQKSCAISYAAQASGPAHQPTWMVKCMINGSEKGTGMGKNQKIAKEEAAKQAFYAMGWGGY